MTSFSKNVANSEQRPSDACHFGGTTPAPRTLVDLFRATASCFPEQPAIRDHLETLSYRTLLERVEVLADTLISQGVGPGLRVGIRMASGRSHLYVGILAILFAGGAYVPVDHDDSDERARLIFDNADVFAILDDQGFHLRRPPSVNHATLGVDDDAWVIFTSGSTGTPKGVAITHRSGAALVDAEAKTFLQDSPLGPGDFVMAGLSVSFDASIEEMWLAWRSGACLVPFTREEMRSGPDLAPLIVERGITALSTVPSLAYGLTANDLSPIRLLILGGESCSEELAARLLAPGREVWNTYGPTEATVIATAKLLRADEPVTIGFPIPGTWVSVVDENDNPVADGQNGQLVIAGAGLGRYLNETSTVSNYRPVPRLGWDQAYFTGDFVEMTPAGLRFIGRRDDQVKISGRRIELGEVEAVAASIRGVRTACAVIRTDEHGEKRLVCYVVADSEFNEGRVHQELVRRLPTGVVPTMALLENLPLKHSGKVDRAALPWPLEATGTAQRFDDPDVDFVAQAWHQVLGPVPLSSQTNFFSAGGTSMSAARVIVILRSRYASCSVADLYQTPVLSDLTRVLSSRKDSTQRVKNASNHHRRAGRRQLILSAGLQALASLRWLATIAVVNALFHLGGFGSTWSWPVLVLTVIALLTQPGRLVVSALLIRIVRVGISPGSYSRAGITHIRLWACERIGDVLSVDDAVGTPWITMYARMLGCRIGRHVTMVTTPPVTGFLSVGDLASIEDGVDLGGWSMYSDCIQVGHIEIGAGARIGARSVINEDIRVGTLAEIEMGSLVTDDVSDGTYVAGSPARTGIDAHGSWDYTTPTDPRPSRPWLYVVGTFILSSITLISLAPTVALYVITGPGVQHTAASIFWAVRWSIPALILSLTTYATLVAGTVRWAARYAQPGVYPVNSLPAFSSWLIERLSEEAREALFPLYASVATPWWLRQLGMKVGSNTEISTVVGQLHLVTVSDFAFLADDVLLAPREIRNGRVRLGTVMVGERAFVGNSAIVRGDHHVPDGTLIGVSSEAPRGARANAAYLGLPALEFPHHATESDTTRTFLPSASLRRARAGVELARIVPLLISYITMEATYFYGVLVAARDPLLSAVVELAVLLLASALSALAVTVIAKWLLIGRVRKGQHPLWSSFVWRDELTWTFIESLAVPWASSTLLGTPVMNIFFRALGARIGHNVWCETWYLDDPDLVNISDNVVIGRNSDIQTHLFHDRLLRLDMVTIERNVSVGSNTYVLPGSFIGTEAEIGAGSLVPRNESVPAQSAWWGNPVIAMDNAEQRV
ncbi:MAG: AMP-binding protein [Acidimicrobiaceae bacterium]|nr:AMP-binding protein [Acidimicrobiaceae bacterium]